MITRILGGSGLEVSAIGLGCMGLSHAYGLDIPEQDGIDVIRGAVDLGVTFFDTAQVYDRSRTKNCREGSRPGPGTRVVIATKFGSVSTAAVAGLNSRPEHIQATVEDSLHRLRTDRIDLLYQHRVDPDVPSRTSPATVKDLVHSGKVAISACRGWGGLIAAPTPSSGHRAAERVLLWWREPSRDPADPARSSGSPGSVQPIGKGFLTGTIDSTTIFGERLARTPCPGSPRRPEANQELTDTDLQTRSRKGANQRSWRWRGCWPSTRRSCPSRHDQDAPTEGRTVPPSMSNSAPRARRDHHRRDQVDIRGDRYPHPAEADQPLTRL